MWQFLKWFHEDAATEENPLQQFIVNTERDGRLSGTGIFQSSDRQLKQLIQRITAFFRETSGPNRLVFYCHGGLVSEERAKEALASRYETFLQNGIYPVFFIWQSSFLEALEDHLRNTMDSRIHEISAGEIIADQVIEEAAKLFPEPWNAMKRRAEQVFASYGGGWKFFTLLAKTLRQENLQAEIHLVGHSAGSIVLYTFLKQLLEERLDFYPYVKIMTCSLFAPACSVEEFEDIYARAQERLIYKRFFLYTLSDELEREDTSVPLYSKSILYLISRGLEGQEGNKPILGMEIYAKDCQPLQKMIARGTGAWIVADGKNQPIFFPATSGDITLISQARQHGDFSYDPDTLNSTMRTILNRNELPKSF